VTQVDYVVCRLLFVVAAGPRKANSSAHSNSCHPTDQLRGGLIKPDSFERVREGLAAPEVWKPLVCDANWVRLFPTERDAWLIIAMFFNDLTSTVIAAGPAGAVGALG
jgi:hypothetical protein